MQWAPLLTSDRNPSLAVLLLVPLLLCLILSYFVGVDLDHLLKQVSVIKKKNLVTESAFHITFALASAAFSNEVTGCNEMEETKALGMTGSQQGTKSLEYEQCGLIGTQFLLKCYPRSM